jgi:hypothetical protein
MMCDWSDLRHFLSQIGETAWCCFVGGGTYQRANSAKSFLGEVATSAHAAKRSEKRHQTQRASDPTGIRPNELVLGIGE